MCGGRPRQPAFRGQARSAPAAGLVGALAAPRRSAAAGSWRSRRAASRPRWRRWSIHGKLFMHTSGVVNNCYDLIENVYALALN